jgi:hypothetical protein
MQQQQFPKMHYPRILVFLVHSILRLNGCKSEGIFRVPGDADCIINLRLRLEKNEYNDDGIHDPNVPAGLLKYWLRELGEPLIPELMYEDCIAHSDSAAHAQQVISSLPDINKRVAQFLIKFLQKVAEPEHQKHTKMSAQNLAMVFAPSFLRCPSDNPTYILEYTKHEQMFLMHLILHADYPIDIINCPY